ncbi:spore protease YyaC [Clostridium cylindrosporum]|uniref:Sporulation protein YyaC n=1 Tax=Clostridium cylindrosporum DSM 605 TaxID=1121307 RepID=A0A0J8D9N8_CLOCY|nr:spore protease YyaC [Clostridium cylindrosporum]KMT22770.1 sporulation protein YyaC [Clostridium cylindrosporum DSM 605]
MTSSISDNIGVRVNYLDKDAVEKIGTFLSEFLKENTIIVCIGTDKCIGDSVGPLVGTFLTKEDYPFPVVGTLEFPTHAVNLDKVLSHVYETYPDHFVIAVDACIGNEDAIGDIQVKFGPVHPGKGVGKTLPKVGDISVVAVVDTIDNCDIFSMRSIRLNFIMQLSETIKDAFILANNMKT